MRRVRPPSRATDAADNALDANRRSCSEKQRGMSPTSGNLLKLASSDTSFRSADMPWHPTDNTHTTAVSGMMGMHVAQSTYLNGHGAIGTDIQVAQRGAGKVGDVLDGVLVQAQLPQVPVLGQRAAWDEVDDVVLEPQPLQARAAAVR